MAGSASNYLEEKFLNATFRGEAFPTPANLYIGLHTADPTEAGGVAEISAGWYARQDLAQGGLVSSAFTPPSAGSSTITNAKPVLFPPVTAATVTATHMAVYDAPSGGNMLFSTPLVSPKTLEVGDVFSLAVGGLSVTAS